MHFTQKKNVAALLTLFNHTLTVLLVFFFVLVWVVLKQVELDLVGNPLGLLFMPKYFWAITITLVCFLVADWLFVIRWMRGKKSARPVVFWFTIIHLIAVLLGVFRFFSYSFNRSLAVYPISFFVLFLLSVATDGFLFWSILKEKTMLA